jgi:hypothetical protein
MNVVEIGGSGNSVVAKMRTTITAESMAVCTRNEKTNVLVRIGPSTV